MKLKLDQLEANLQKLVEDQLAGILPGKNWKTASFNIWQLR